MNSRLLFGSSALLLLAGAAGVLVLRGQESEKAVHAGPASAVSGKPAAGTAGGAARKEPAPLAAYQARLLDFAFDTASAIPPMPHIKTRSSCQEAVVVASLELDQPERAAKYVEGIDNWRKGAGYGDLAFYLAQHGDTEGADRYLELAGRIVDESTRAEDADAEVEDAAIEGTQTWRIDRIRAKIARAYLELGRPADADAWEVGLEPSEAGTVAVQRAVTLGSDAFDSQISRLDTVATTSSFDEVQSTLGVATNLYDRFYADEERRSIAEEKFAGCLEKMPAQLRIETWMRLAELSLEHDDAARALQHSERARELVLGGYCSWDAHEEAPFTARLARIRHQAGKRAEALAELDGTLARFLEKQGTVLDMYRAEALNPIAEAYRAMGEEHKALEVYGMAVEEGSRNPNARQRAEDLASTCVSMARQGCEPDEALWQRIQAIRAGLQKPW